MITATNVFHMLKRRVGLEKEGREWLLEMMPKYSVCAEIGVFWGEFSDMILRQIRPKELHLIDPWKFEPGPEFFCANYGTSRSGSQERMEEIYQRVVRKFGSRPNVRLHRSPSLACVNLFPDNYFDWIYVDGDHRYEGALGDLIQYRPKLKPGGFVCGDDYARKRQHWGDGVTIAVDEVIAKGIYEKVVLDREGTQFILRRPPVLSNLARAQQERPVPADHHNVA